MYSLLWPLKFNLKQMITYLHSVSWWNTAFCSHLFLTTAKYIKEEHNSLCKPRIGGCSGGGSGNENLTMYSRGFCSNSVGPWSSSFFWTLLRFFSCFLVRASFCFFSYKDENFNWKVQKKENPYNLTTYDLLNKTFVWRFQLSVIWHSVTSQKTRILNHTTVKTSKTVLLLLSKFYEYQHSAEDRPLYSLSSSLSFVHYSMCH